MDTALEVCVRIRPSDETSDYIESPILINNENAEIILESGRRGLKKVYSFNSLFLNESQSDI